MKFSTAEVREIISSEKNYLPGDFVSAIFGSGNPYTLNGPQRRALFLTGGEVLGPVSDYIYCREIDNNVFETKYLSELEPGVSVLTFDIEGNSKNSEIISVETRTIPSMFVKARCNDFVKSEMPGATYKQGNLAVFLDPERSILVSKNGNPIAAKDLKTGDEVCLTINLDDIDSHFGTPVKGPSIRELGPLIR